VSALQQVARQLESAEYRAVYADVPVVLTRQAVWELLAKEFPALLGYQRKDPFDTVLHLLSLLNEETLHYSLLNDSPFEDLDEWDLFYKRSMLQPHHLVYSAIESTLCLNYLCPKCNRPLSVPHNIQFLKLNIPKKKRKVREVEKELASHRVSSPVKARRKSLMNFFKEEECPITVPELIIELMKAPLHKEYFPPHIVSTANSAASPSGRPSCTS
jgi:hypothetical protein